MRDGGDVRNGGEAEPDGRDSTPPTTRRAGGSLTPARSLRGGGVGTAREPAGGVTGRRAAGPESRPRFEPAAAPSKRGEPERPPEPLVRPGMITDCGRTPPEPPRWALR